MTLLMKVTSINTTMTIRGVVRSFCIVCIFIGFHPAYSSSQTCPSGTPEEVKVHPTLAASPNKHDAVYDMPKPTGKIVKAVLISGNTGDPLVLVPSASMGLEPNEKKGVIIDIGEKTKLDRRALSNIVSLESMPTIDVWMTQPEGRSNQVVARFDVKPNHNYRNVFGETMPLFDITKYESVSQINKQTDRQSVVIISSANTKMTVCLAPMPDEEAGRDTTTHSSSKEKDKDGKDDEVQENGCEAKRADIIVVCLLVVVVRVLH